MLATASLKPDAFQFEKQTNPFLLTPKRAETWAFLGRAPALPA